MTVVIKLHIFHVLSCEMFTFYYVLRETKQKRQTTSRECAVQTEDHLQAEARPHLTGLSYNPCYFSNADLNTTCITAHRIFVRGHYLFREANSFPRVWLEENCELRGTANYNVQGQISEHIFAPNGDRVYYPSNRFYATRAVLKIRVYLTITP